MGVFSSVPDIIGDSEQFSALQSDLGDDVIALLLARAQETVTGGLGSLHQALEDNNSSQVREIAHTLKGACGSLYAVQFAQMAAEMEKNITDLEMVRAAMPEFAQSAEKTLAWWHRQLG